MRDESGLPDLQASIKELSVINRVLDRIGRVRETNHIMSIIIDECMAFTGATQGVINLIEKKTDEELVTIARDTAVDPERTPFKVTSLISGWVLDSRQTLKVDDLDSDDRFRGMSSDGGRFKSILCSPLIVRGDIIGLLSLVRDEQAGPFDDIHARVTGIIASQSAQLLSNAILLEELARKNELLEISSRQLRDENARLFSEISETFSFENIVGHSEKLRRVLKLASKICGNDSPVLITGPTGTGKELLAKAIHMNSPRRGMPFIVKNCGVKTESLLESELFGHVKGAFTGADRDKSGLFKEADGGTIFLDEIADAPASTQVAILRVLETGEIRPIGASKTEYVDVRIISATNKNLAKEIEAGKFREDLFYRLNTFTLDLPPLRERPEDIAVLADHFVEQLKLKLHLDELRLSPEALEVLSDYSWPGNIRQLRNEIERAAVLSGGRGVIETGDLSAELFHDTGSASTGGKPAGKLREITEQLEQDLITKTLKETGGNILQTSKILGLTRKGLKDKMSRYGITADDV